MARMPWSAGLSWRVGPITRYQIPMAAHRTTVRASRPIFIQSLRRRAADGKDSRARAAQG